MAITQQKSFYLYHIFIKLISFFRYKTNIPFNFLSIAVNYFSAHIQKLSLIFMIELFCIYLWSFEAFLPHLSGLSTAFYRLLPQEVIECSYSQMPELAAGFDEDILPIDK